MSVRALQQYLEARDALAQGKTPAATQHLERAVGSPQGNPVIARELPQLLDHRTLAGSALLELLRVEVNRRER